MRDYYIDVQVEANNAGWNIVHTSTKPTASAAESIEKITNFTQDVFTSHLSTEDKIATADKFLVNAKIIKERFDDKAEGSIWIKIARVFLFFITFSMCDKEAEVEAKKAALSRLVNDLSSSINELIQTQKKRDENHFPDELPKTEPEATDALKQPSVIEQEAVTSEDDQFLDCEEAEEPVYDEALSPINNEAENSAEKPAQPQSEVKNDEEKEPEEETSFNRFTEAATLMKEDVKSLWDIGKEDVTSLGNKVAEVGQQAMAKGFSLFNTLKDAIRPAEDPANLEEMGITPAKPRENKIELIVQNDLGQDTEKSAEESSFSSLSNRITNYVSKLWYSAQPEWDLSIEEDNAIAIEDKPSDKEERFFDCEGVEDLDFRQ